MLRILSRESVLPVSLERVRAFLRIETESENDLLERLILSAIEEVETLTGLLLTKCVCVMTYEEVSADQNGLVEKISKEVSIRIPHVPFLKMESIQSGERKILDYRLKVSSQDVAICDVVIPSHEVLTLTYHAGFENVPEVLKMAVLEIVAFRYEHRGEGNLSAPGIESFLRPYRTLHL